MRKIIIAFLIIPLFLLLIGCTTPKTENVTTPVVCNDTYILVGSSCCLDQNNNAICDSDETEKPSAEVGTNAPVKDGSTSVKAESSPDALISQHPLRLALYSSEIEAGYSLSRKSSGQYKYDSEDFQKLDLTKITGSFVTSYEKRGSQTGEERYLTIYTKSFKTIEDAKAGFKIIEDRFKEDPLFETKEWTLMKAGDEKNIFLKNYQINFYSYSKYIGVMRIKNIIYEAILTAPASESTGTELWNYIEKLDKKAQSDNIGIPEVDTSSVSEIGAKAENLIEVKATEVTRSPYIKKADEYKYVDIENAGTNKDYLMVTLYFKNLKINNEYTMTDGSTKRGIDTSYYNFAVTDENGNYYDADYFSYALEDGDEGEILQTDEGMHSAYFFKVLKDSKKFTLVFYDENVEIYELQI